MSQKAVKRLSSELKEMIKSPPPLADARPDEHNILRWVFVLEGAPDTPYEGGEYIGELLFPDQYPFKPPSIKMVTPSGRFKTQTRLCFSMSDFHPEEWSPMWGVRQILIGLNSFMSEAATTHGSLTTTDAAKRDLALKSHAFNTTVREYEAMFPDRCSAAVQRVAAAEEAASLAAAKKARKQQNSGADGALATSSSANAATATGAAEGFASTVAAFLGSWRGAAALVGAASIIALLAAGSASSSDAGAGVAASVSGGGWAAPPVGAGLGSPAGS